MSSHPARWVSAVLAALVLVAAPAALAKKPFNDASLEGEYHFTLIEIAVTEESLTIYCNGYGRVVFDGAGAAEITQGYGVCTDGDPAVAVPSFFTYSVAPDGAVEIIDEDGTPNHCQLADKGALLLCDGSGGPGGAPPPERALWMVTAAKL